MSITTPADIVALRDEFTRMMMAYKFGLDEVMTKVNILKEEFQFTHDYNPIEHVASRLKSPESILAKVTKLGLALDVDAIRSNLFDIAGVRITCSFISDITTIQRMIAAQRDVTVLQVKDYITEPKPSGYRSLHMIIETPVHLTDRVENVIVEVQLRTIAMDFWASLEHKIFYKYDKSVPDHLIAELHEAASAANELDRKMEQLHTQVIALDTPEGADDGRWTSPGRLPLASEILRALAARERPSDS